MRMFVILLLLTGSCKGSDQAVEVKKVLQQTCYSVGTCIPSAEPQGTPSEICSTFKESVRCLKKALEACRLLGFPADTLAEGKRKVKELTQILALECSSPSTTTLNGTSTHLVPTAASNETLFSSTSDTTSPLPDDEGEADTERHTKSGVPCLHHHVTFTAPLILLCVSILLSAITTSTNFGLLL